ncbi:unnamed protein product [Hymenolepis diminuta]|uniref:Uncharacterized protein n=1 Tax=Hymenolepis diminuta TaxID=6216 RepID=A0A564YTK6_HYMDI|nr:unnamed protein product [Hymenolepis diminuta]
MTHNPSLSLSVTRCGFFEYILVYSTFGVLFHNCCWLLLKQLRSGDYCCCRNLFAVNRWLLSNSNNIYDL